MRQILSFSLFSVLLLSYGLNSFHDALFHHHDEFVCEAEGQLHFHDWEEDCTLCDYFNSTTVITFHTEETVLSAVFSAIEVDSISANYVNQEFICLDHRGPPTQA